MALSRHDRLTLEVVCLTKVDYLLVYGLLMAASSQKRSTISISQYNKYSLDLTSLLAYDTRAVECWTQR